MAMRTGPKVSFLAAVNGIAGHGSGGTGEEAEITWHRWGGFAGLAWTGWFPEVGDLVEALVRVLFSH